MYSVCLVPACTQVIINEKTLCKGFFKRAIRVLVVLIDCEVVDPLSLRVVFKSQQPAKCAGFSARFRQLLSLLHESKYVEEMDPQPSTFHKTPATLKLKKNRWALGSFWQVEMSGAGLRIKWKFLHPWCKISLTKIRLTFHEFWLILRRRSRLPCRCSFLIFNFWFSLTLKIEMEILIFDSSKHEQCFYLYSFNKKKI